MSEIIAFAAGFLIAWPTWFCLLFLCLWADYAESVVWTIFLAILFTLSTYFLLNLEPQQLLWVVPVYIVAGIAWSLWRWRRKCEKMVANNSSNRLEEYHLRDLKRKLDPTNNTDIITTWILTWPFGVVVHFCHDAFHLVGKLVDTYLIGAYRAIGDSAYSKLPSKDAAPQITSKDRW